jgi:hypothetical protein
MNPTTPVRMPLHHHVRKVFKKTHDPLWQMQLGVVSVIVLQLLTSHEFLPLSKLWLVAAEVVLLLSLVVITTEGYRNSSRSRRKLAIILIAVIAAFNVLSLVLLINALIFGHTEIDGRGLLANGLVVYITNIMLFALWYWELDGHGPDARTAGQTKRDFLFPQMIHAQFASTSWLPGFADYMYLSATNVTNFASSDTQPLTHRAKLLMLLQSFVAVVTVVLVLARAINVLH